MKKKTLLFLDPVCSRPYDDRVFQEGNCGGTELTTAMLAEALGATGRYDVIVEQYRRDERRRSEHAAYVVPWDTRRADYVVCLRDPRSMILARQRFPDARIFLYSHDLATFTLAFMFESYLMSKCEANIVVSQFHKEQTYSVFGYIGQWDVKVIYNPVDDAIQPDATQYDPNRLLFLSTKEKGLDYTLKVFKTLQAANPNFYLEIANPGYREDAAVEIPNVHLLGSLPHQDVIAKMRTALCVFFPNVCYPETFGRVFAEANAVGTPVLTHDLGAATEVLDPDKGQIVDCRDEKAVINRVLQWHQGGRPIVRCRPEFRLSNVVKVWTELLD